MAEERVASGGLAVLIAPVGALPCTRTAGMA